jgi:hypothetical protein
MADFPESRIFSPYVCKAATAVGIKHGTLRPEVPLLHAPIMKTWRGSMSINSGIMGGHFLLRGFSRPQCLIAVQQLQGVQ